ncbi:MAG: AtpZ/AtpI family protein [Bacteroidales bacterium]|nr:AtpZ/AtpI family protein [Bacteroidales bacterium]
MEKDQKDSPLKFYAKYSTLAIQMVVIIVGSAFGGRALDKWLEWQFPVFTLALTILGVVAALILGLRDLFNKKQ